MSRVLIASLGDSPVVVTSLFDLLRKEKNVDQLIVFYTDGSLACIGYQELICNPLHHKYPECTVVGIPLYTRDMNSEGTAYDFLRQLHLQLNKHQANRDTVYLSLAGGRKSMAALMALLAPLFPCVQNLYHILDKDEGKNGHHFWSTSRLYDLPTEEDKHRRLFPSHERVSLISVPYEPQKLNTEINSLLYNITTEELDELWERDAEKAEIVEFYNLLTQTNDRGGLLTVELTENAVKQYQKLLKRDATRGRKFTACFKQMHYAKRLMAGLRTNKEDGAHGNFFSKALGLTFHFYKSHEHATERAVYHTEPQDIAATSAAYIKKVVISELEFEVSGRYRDLEDIVNSPSFSLKEPKSFEAVSPAESGAQERILIVPLGIRPMVATQLYQLYIDGGDIVRSVILVHTNHPHVCDSVEIACDAFKGIRVDCEPVMLKEWEDIDTPEACRDYQKLLEETIRKTHQENPSCQIELAISGGRKGMAALATFVAQNLGIRHVVHTVIHERLNDTVEKETTVEKLRDLEDAGNKKKRDDRLFLRAYKENKEAFALFNIPVLPTQKG